jgi:hypothetical protein
MACTMLIVFYVEMKSCVVKRDQFFSNFAVKYVKRRQMIVFNVGVIF